MIIIYLSIKHMAWARKRNVLGRRFFYAAKTCVLETVIKIVHTDSLFSEYIVLIQSHYSQNCRVSI